MSANAPALQVQGVTKTFRVHHDKANSLKKLVTRGQGRYDDFVALQDVTFDVRDGEVFGVIGENGSGKSTLLKCMAGILVPNSGKVHVNRRMSALLELGAGFHPELSGRDNVFLNAAILGMGRRDIASRFDSIVEFSGLENFIDTPVKSYSTGMYVRLAFAVAINVDPQLLLIDEILAVGDVSFQQKCMEKFVDFRNEGRTIVLVTHSMTSVRDMCDRAVWLEHGKVVGHGDPAELVELYTERMLGARSGDREGDQSVRYGTGEIQVHKVEIFVGGGTEPVKRFRTGDDIRVKAHYRTAKRVPRPILAVAIESLGGALVTAPATRDVGLIPEFIDRDGTFEVEFKNVPLLPGTYDLHTSISDFNRQHIYDNLRVATRFDVMTGRSYETGGALITMSPSWTL